jgi:hypothetical protein
MNAIIMMQFTIRPNATADKRVDANQHFESINEASHVVSIHLHIKRNNA